MRVDNAGAIFMIANVSKSSQTKYVNTKYHFVRESMGDGFIQIIFVRSELNASDVFMKKVMGDIYDAHTADYMTKCEIIFR